MAQWENPIQYKSKGKKRGKEDERKQTDKKEEEGVDKE